MITRRLINCFSSKGVKHNTEAKNSVRKRYQFAGSETNTNKFNICQMKTYLCLWKLNGILNAQEIPVLCIQTWDFL